MLYKKPILHNIYDPNNYEIDLIKNSKRVVYLLIINDFLENEDISMLWKVSQSNIKFRHVMLKIIEELAPVMKSSHRVQLLNYFKNEQDISKFEIH